MSRHLARRREWTGLSRPVDLAGAAPPTAEIVRSDIVESRVFGSGQRGDREFVHSPAIEP